MTDDFKTKLDAFAALLEAEQWNQHQIDHPGLTRELLARTCTVTVKERKKYVTVDVGTSGKYIVVKETGEIFGIKAYGVIHRGNQFGTLDTINEFYWGDYRAYRRKPTRFEEQAAKIKSLAPGI